MKDEEMLGAILKIYLYVHVHHILYDLDYLVSVYRKANTSLL